MFYLLKMDTWQKIIFIQLKSLFLINKSNPMNNNPVFNQYLCIKYDFNKLACHLWKHAFYHGPIKFIIKINIQFYLYEYHFLQTSLIPTFSSITFQSSPKKCDFFIAFVIGFFKWRFKIGKSFFNRRQFFKNLYIDFVFYFLKIMRLQ